MQRLMAIGLMLFFCFLSSAQSAPFKRHVLGIYNSAEGKTHTFNPLRSQVEMPLNYLGLKLEYHDIANGLPSNEAMSRYRGVMVWFDHDAMDNALAYWRWVEVQLKAGRQIVLLTGARPLKDAQTGRRLPLYVVNQILGLMGLRVGVEKTDLALDIELVFRESKMVEYERRLEAELVRFAQMQSVGKGNDVFLKLRMRSTQAISDAVVITPNGGLVMPGYLRFLDMDTQKRQWRVNPFAFFARALKAVDTPRLDYTTVTGTRLAYSHIDGDGLANMSYTEKKLSAEIIRDEIIKAYPELPFTVSVIIWEVMQKTGLQKRTLAAARSLFRLPNVEPASHTFSHPLVWNLAQVDSARIAYYQEVMTNTFVKGRALIPWDIEGYEFDPARETTLSCKFIEDELLPPGKKCEILLWSGNTLPDEETLAVCEQGGVMNMNGGDARFDGEYPSYSYVTPLYRQVGDVFQIHSSNSNENTYTNLWTGPFGGFQNVIQTFENTEKPMRVSPVNVYYHFYSGERPAGLLALRRVYAWLKVQDVFHIYASDYIKVVKGFIDAEIEQLRENTWRITKNKDCRTVRFDHVKKYPDFGRSSGIIGFYHYQNSLYIHLRDGDESVLVLSDNPPNQVYLSRANVKINDIAISDDQIRFEAHALGEGRFSWHNLKPLSVYNIRAESDAGVQTLTVRSDSKGALTFGVFLNGGARIRVSSQNGAG